MILRLSVWMLAAAACLLAADAKVEVLWPNGAPGALGTLPVDVPELSIYLPASGATGTGVVICPGGGYQTLSMEKEGSLIAEWLNKLGVAGFVLKYRLGPRYHDPAMIQDAQRAIRTVRVRATEFGLDPSRIGIWGFSAGGHLASTAATHFDAGNPAASEPLDRVSSRPDFAILSYAVITMDLAYTHRGSRNNLLGPNPDPKLVESLSNELQVTDRTPPTFLFHTTADTTVPVENSINFYLALRKAKVPAEMHIYERGAHGVGLAPQDPVLSSWPDRLAAWLRVRGLLTRM